MSLCAVAWKAWFLRMWRARVTRGGGKGDSSGLRSLPVVFLYSRSDVGTPPQLPQAPVGSGPPSAPVTSSRACAHCLPGSSAQTVPVLNRHCRAFASAAWGAPEQSQRLAALSDPSTFSFNASSSQRPFLNLPKVFPLDLQE